MYKKLILKRSLCALLSVIIIAACLPLSVFAADPSEPQFSSDAANTLMKNTKPTGFDNTTNPYGYDVGRPFAMVEKNELLYFETYGESATGKIADVGTPESLKNFISKKGTASDASLPNMDISALWKYYAFVQSVSFDPFGSGRRDHVAYVGLDKSDKQVYSKIKGWLLERTEQEDRDSVSIFLSKLDEFDLNEYIKVIKFEELKVPSVPFQLPSSKTYFGIKEMMESELDFLKATVLSKSTAPVTMYSDMPLKEMAKDPDFPKKWMFGMAMMLKKGLHLNQIHNLDRSFDEMMLGLESWIPMYMTGQISPYYFKNIQNNVFLHFLKVSGAAALSGEAIAGYHADGKYYLTKSKREVEYYQKRADEMLSNAYPLMDIYRSERENDLNAFLSDDTRRSGKRRSILSTLPLYTMSEKLLNRILSRYGTDAEQAEKIKKNVAAQKKRIMTILETEIIEDSVPIFTPEEFVSHPPVLELAGVFCERDILYSKAEYEEHLKETEAFAERNPNYVLNEGISHAFRNLQILIHEGQWAMVSKGNSPAIHFVIRHPKLRSAIENFIPPVTEE